MSKDRKPKAKKKNSFFLSIKAMLFGANSVKQDVLTEEQMQSPARTAAKNFRENKVAMFGAIIFVTIFLLCFILPIFFPLDKTFQDPTQKNVAPGLSIMNVPSALKNNVKEISVGSTYGVGVDKGGKVYVWGKLPNKNLKNIPSKMGKVVHVSAGLNHILAVNEDGEVFTWGETNRFKLSKIPDEVKDSYIKEIYAGHQISLALTDKGYLYYWGNDNLVQITIHEDLQGQYDKIIANTETAMAILKDGKVVNLSNHESPFSRIPDEIQGKTVDLALTAKSAAAVTKDGKIYTWGSSDDDILTVPTEINGKATQVEAGRSHFTALTSDGNVYSWGNNIHGQIDAPKKYSSGENIYCGYYQNYAVDDAGKVTTWGKSGYLMGTDGFGRDIVIRLLSGGRMTMTIGAIAVIIETIIGIIVGGLAGYYGGKIDNLLMRLAEVVGAIPFLPLAIILSAIVGTTISETARIAMIMIILGALSWPGLARLVRGQILAEREKEFVTAAKAMGIRELSIIFKHIVPNVITVIIVSTTLSFATCLLTESSLSFIGFGVLEPSPTWGNMLTGSQTSEVMANFWWRWVFPSIALSLSTIGINLIGDGLRDAIDPKSNER